MKVNVINVATKKTSKCYNGHGACLTHDEYGFWFDAALSDDAEAVDRYLISVGETRSTELLTGHICSNDDKCIDEIRGLALASPKSISYRYPTHLAVVGGALKLLQLAHKYGANFLITDKNGDNIVHAMVRGTSLMPNREAKACEVFIWLTKNLPAEDIQQLLTQENDHERRPLEMAAHLGTFGLFNEIMRSDQYLKQKKCFGMFRAEYYDVTEYESYNIDNNRRMKSPLWYIVHMDAKLLGKDRVKSFFDSNPVKVWCKMKIRANLPLIFIWFLLRFLAVALGIYWDLSGGSLCNESRMAYDQIILGNMPLNGTHCRIETLVANQAIVAPAIVVSMLRYIILGTGFMVILFDIIEVTIWLANGWFKRFYRTPDGGFKSLVTNYIEFRLIMFLMASSCVIMFIGLQFSHSVLTNIAYLCYTTLSLWSILYFGQILSWLGPKIIAIELLIKETLSYVLIIVMLILPLSCTIMSLLTRNHIGPCPDSINFNDIPLTLYTGFTILLNMVNLTGFPMEEYYSIYLFHAMFFVLIPILILNFIIASFSDTISTLTENAQAVHTIQQLSMAMQVEYRVGYVFPCLVKWLKKRTFQTCHTGQALYVNRLIPRNY